MHKLDPTLTLQTHPPTMVEPEIPPLTTQTYTTLRKKQDMATTTIHQATTKTKNAALDKEAKAKEKRTKKPTFQVIWVNNPFKLFSNLVFW